MTNIQYTINEFGEFSPKYYPDTDYSIEVKLRGLRFKEKEAFKKVFNTFINEWKATHKVGGEEFVNED